MDRDCRITVPFGPYRGRDGAAKRDRAFREFAAALEDIQARLDYRMGARDWCYHLEEHGLEKPDFDKAEKRISDARKHGYLPVDFTLEDDNRLPTGDHGLGSDLPVTDELEWIWNEQIQGHLAGYTPIDWVDYQPCYIELLVEKKGLGSLFTKIAQEFHFNVSNGKGDTDIISVANMHRRFQDAEGRGQRPVLLYCGDFDPKGLLISNILPKRFAEGVGRFFRDGTVLKPIDLEVNRFGLNIETIDALRLSKTPNLLTGTEKVKCTDGKERRGIGLDNPLHPDHAKPYVQEYLELTGGEVFKVEANALMVRPDEGRQLLRETVARYVDVDGMQRYQRDVSAARQQLKTALPGYLAQRLEAA